MPNLVITRRVPADNAHLPANLHPVIRQIYADRGVQNEQQLLRTTQSLLHYNELKGVSGAVNLLVTAIQSQQKIMVVGDFDADGATSTALCMLSLTMLGSKQHSYLVPNRFDFGYGLSPEIVDVAAREGAELIMTVDSGIACFAGVEKAKALGLKVLITDHHLAASRLPIADAIVNPNQPGCEFLSKNLAGVGVAFYLMLALRAELNKQNWFARQNMPMPNLAELLDIVALGTVADVVPLDSNNRILVHQGLQRIRSDQCCKGIQAIMEVAGRDKSKLMASDLGFVVGPRLNAAGRLDDMSLGIECLLTDNPARARQIAVQLDSLNQERREIESSMQQEAVKALEQLNLAADALPFGLVLYKQDYHQGVIGILAGRIKEKYFRPTIAFAHQDDALLKGSARSIPGVHIRDLLETINSQYPGLIIKFGGHAMAAGLTIELAKLAEFEQAFHLTTEALLKGKPLAGEVLSDGVLLKDQYSIAFAQLLKDAGPWGQGFPEPVFDDEFELLEQKLLGGKHLKMLVRFQEHLLLDAIAFNIDPNAWPNLACRKVRLAFKLDINEFRGRVNLQLMVDAIEPI
ncbi:MAG: single-stranded-DNA-specific exonuclease RecJ [Paraglaciecola sp.]|uniref:single-stranded-DNA-specific exonuclease RecJ n=1 Tax=Paraglaciecola sp. TaxID=1920173 RepID=UPI00273FC089|nr:single-stranded-DNA-specific exonuclease RecJ [Paraglaciecola sp.]MDP5032882.1 single-stranded-DNA-specific exonuclease RecJ [Paraglaciecola sp.]MDP5132818.1 single-stranded-DNA-specific exonuclease RecJ [Paraglaciecola sp.]